jgi:IS30 family transposase
MEPSNFTRPSRKCKHLNFGERIIIDQMCRRLPDKSQNSVVKAINGIEREYGAVKFREIFKSITADNGSEAL